MRPVIFASLAGCAGAVFLLPIAACTGDDPVFTDELGPEAGSVSPPGTGPSPPAPPPGVPPPFPGDAAVDGLGPILPEGGPDASKSTSSFVFVAKAMTAANLGGVSGADGRCQDIARARGFGGLYRAWLSTSAIDAITRIHGTGPWIRTDGRIVFEGKQQLANLPSVPILLDEAGDATVGTSRAWTGTKVGGTRTPFHCNNWTVPDPTLLGTQGEAEYRDERWTSTQGEGTGASGGVPCGELARVICLRAD